MNPKQFWITFGTHVTLVDTSPRRMDQVIPAIHVIEYSAYEEIQQRWEATKDDRNLVDNANIKLNYEVIALRVALERCLEIFKYCQGPTRDVKTWKLKEGEELINKVLNGEF